MPRSQTSGSAESSSFSSKYSSTLGKEIVKTEKDIHRIDGSGVGSVLQVLAAWLVTLLWIADSGMCVYD
jgi:hypothetical protein